jgi:outer membrane protein TolC
MKNRFQVSGFRFQLLIIGLMALIVLSSGFGSFSLAQEDSQKIQDLSKNPEWFPRFYKPYVKQSVPDVELTNSPGLLQSIREGKIKISLDQLRAIVIENNLDLLASQNTVHYVKTEMLRAKGGGAPRGVTGVSIPSSLFSGAIGAGIGGSSSLGAFGNVGGTSYSARSVFGVSRGSYDPSFALGFSVDSTTSPLNSIVLSGLPEVTTHSAALQARYSQAFTTGSSFSLSFNNMRQSYTQKYLLYNPAFISQLSISLTQQLLSGFGRTIGRRFLSVVENEDKMLQESLRTQTNTVLSQAQSAYWDLTAARENVHVAEESLALAERFLSDIKKKDEIGTASGLEVATAESEVAARKRDLVAAQTAQQISEVDLKKMFSKDLADVLSAVQIEPADALPNPRAEDIPKLNDALAAAMSKRPEIRQAETNLLTQDIAIKYTKDVLKPSLLLFANFNSAGLYGNRTISDNNGFPILFPGGASQAMRQVRNWGYPEYAVGFSFSLNIRNRAAEADYHRARLEKQQTETTFQRTRSSIALEVRKALIGLLQSKAQVEASQQSVSLSSQVLAAEEAKLLEGVAVPYDVIRRQRDLRSAQFADVQAHAGYAKALVEMRRAMGAME